MSVRHALGSAGWALGLKHGVIDGTAQGADEPGFTTVLTWLALKRPLTAFAA